MKRTNELYNVQLARYAWIAVEAESPQEAMKIAREADLEEYIDDENFDESDTYVAACETYSNELDEMYLKDDDYILTADGAITAKEYEEQLENENL